MRKGWRIFLALIGLLIVGALAGFVIGGETPAPPMPEALAALQSNAQVTITTGEWLNFLLAASQPDTGFIIYPGGRVDPRAYAPMARQVAEQGYLVIIVDMPLNLAVFNPGRPAYYGAAFPRGCAVARLVPGEDRVAGPQHPLHNWQVYPNRVRSASPSPCTSRTTGNGPVPAGKRRSPTSVNSPDWKVISSILASWGCLAQARRSSTMTRKRKDSLRASKAFALYPTD